MIARFASRFHQVTCRVLLLAVIAAPLMGARTLPADTCTWTGAQSGNWDTGGNWSCGHAPTSSDDVVLTSAPFLPYLHSAATVATLSLESGSVSLNGSGDLTVSGNAEVTGDFSFYNDGHYQAASTQVQFGAHLQAGGFGNFDGQVAVEFGGTLSPLASSVMNLRGPVFNAGVMTGGGFSLEGPSLENAGQIVDGTLVFFGPAPQTLSGAGAWVGQTSVSLRGTTVRLSSDVDYGGENLNVTLDSILDLRTFTLSLAAATNVNVPLGNVISGTGELSVSGGAIFTNDGVITPTFRVSGSGATAGGFGPLAGPLIVEAGATLGVKQYGNLLASNVVTIAGRLEGPGNAFLYAGPRLVDNGVVAVPYVDFEAAPQTLLGTGRFLTETLASVEPGAVLRLGSDHQIGAIHITSNGQFDLAGHKLSLSQGGMALTPSGVVTTTNSTVVYNGVVTQTLAVNHIGYHNLTLANPAGVQVEHVAFDLSVAGLLRVQAATFDAATCFCKDVQIDAGARLRLAAGKIYHLTGYWTNNGVYAARGANTLRFEGTAAQTMGGASETVAGSLYITNTAGVQLQSNAQATQTLTLNGDLTVASAKRLTLPLSATTAGSGDVVGQVRRVGPFATGVAYSFGNPFNTLAFAAGTTPPAEFSVNLQKTRPAGLVAAIARTYTLQFSSGSAYTGTLRLHYRDAELGALSEARMQAYRSAAGAWLWEPRTLANTTDNWIQRTALIRSGDWGLAAPYMFFLPVLVR